MKTTGIYRIDLGNNNFYIGSAVNLANRQQQHRRALKRKDHENSRVQNCWNKYGVFEFTVLEECDTADLLVCEQKYLDKHFDDPNNANLTPTAGSSLGVKHSDKSRANMSEAAKLRPPISDETSERISAALKSRPPISDETREKMSASAMGRVHSDEARARMSAAKVGHIVSDKHRVALSEAQKGVPKSAEVRINMSLGQLARWSKIRLDKQLLKEVA